MALQDFIKDRRIIQEIESPGCRVIMVIGASDTGKTTLVEGLLDFLSRREQTAIVDLDIGQSHVGPPTTMAWGRLRGGFSGWSGIAIEDMYFTGVITPMGNLLPVLTGAGILTQRAVSRCGKVVIDTTGLVSGSAGRMLKQFKIDLISPNSIIALERSDELGEILRPFRFQKRMRIHRLDVPPSVGSKCPTTRSRYREEMFWRYFNGAGTVEVDMERVGIRFACRDLPSGDGLRGRLVSFRDSRNMDFAIGVVVDVDTKRQRLKVRTPVAGRIRFSTLVVGTVTLDLKGV